MHPHLTLSQSLDHGLQLAIGWVKAFLPHALPMLLEAIAPINQMEYFKQGVIEAVKLLGVCPVQQCPIAANP
jgi:hypothetical protein